MSGSSAPVPPTPTRLADLPEPLVDASIDLRSFRYMPLWTRVTDSDFFAISTGDEFKAAVALWVKSWTQIPAGSLPNDERVLAHLSGAGSEWSKVRQRAMHGWFLCSDNRYYHTTMAEAIDYAVKKKENYEDKKEKDRLRKEEERKRREEELLKGKGKEPGQKGTLPHQAENSKPVPDDETQDSDIYGSEGINECHTNVTSNSAPNGTKSNVTEFNRTESKGIEEIKDQDQQQQVAPEGAPTSPPAEGRDLGESGQCPPSGDLFGGGSEPNKKPAPKKKTSAKMLKGMELIGPLLALCPDWLDREMWANFVEHRIEIRRPMTMRAGEMNIEILRKLKFEEEQDPGEVIRASIANGWSGLFALKKGGTKAIGTTAGQPAGRNFQVERENVNRAAADDFVRRHTLDGEVRHGSMFGEESAGSASVYEGEAIKSHDQDES